MLDAVVSQEAGADPRITKGSWGVISAVEELLFLMRALLVSISYAVLPLHKINIASP